MGNKPGYKHLLTYQHSTEIEKLVDNFCEIYLDSFKDRRLIEQMVSSARSMPRNIAEGYTRLGLKDYLEFLSFSRASGEELLKDLQRLAEKWKIEIEREKWGKRGQGGEMGNPP
jgi:four helix bundle protein